MTKPLQGLLRPFQEPEIAPPVRVVQPGQQEVKRILLSFGRAGSGKVMSGSASLNKSFYCDRQIVEKTGSDPSPGVGGSDPYLGGSDPSPKLFNQLV